MPYDFNRKRLSILFKTESTHLIITKGALKNILDVCSTVETGEGKAIAIADQRQKLHQQAQDLGSKGFRALGVAYRDFNQDSFTKDDETNMTFLGYLALFDPPKAGIANTLKDDKERRSHEQLEKCCSQVLTTLSPGALLRLCEHFL